MRALIVITAFAPGSEQQISTTSQVVDIGGRPVADVEKSLQQQAPPHHEIVAYRIPEAL